MKLIIVDDHKLFRDGLKILLKRCYNAVFEIEEAPNGVEFIEMIKVQKPDLVLMDIDMPLMNGIEATQKAVEIYPDLRIIALTMFGDEEYYYKMIDAGAWGFLLKDSDISEVKAAIDNVLNGSNYFSEEIMLQVIKNIRPRSLVEDKHNLLSAREMEVLEQICLGLSNQGIAGKLCISKRTVDKHRANLLEKTNTTNTASLVMYAIKHNIVKL